MPSVIVKLIYTPRPEGDETTVRVGGGDYYPIKFDSEYGSGEVLAAVPLNTTAAEAIAVAQALTLVAGCADTRWRGWHWEAREANGQLLATTPVGECYVNREDCLKAVRTLFGYGVRVELSDDIGHAGLLRSAYDRDAIDPDADPEEYPVGSVEL